MAIRPVAVGASIFAALHDIMREQDAARRAGMLEREELANRVLQRQQAEQAMRRQAMRDQQADADRLARIHGPNVDLSTPAADVLRQGGYQMDSRTTLPARTMTGDPTIGIVSGELPSTSYTRRGETYAEQLAREQREAAQAEKDEQRQWRTEDRQERLAATATQAEANRQAAAERAQAERDMKLLIADMARSGSAETRALANELRRLQIAAAQDKLDTTRETRERDAAGARQTTESALRHVNRLLDPNDVGGSIGAATGAYEMRGFTQGAQDFNSVRDQLVAALTQPNLGALKGPMSDKDVSFIKQLATRLENRRMSAQETQRALIEARAFLQSKVGASAGGNTGSGNPHRIGRFEVEVSE